MTRRAGHACGDECRSYGCKARGDAIAAETRDALLRWYRGAATPDETAALIAVGLLRVSRYGGHVVASTRGVRLSEWSDERRCCATCGRPEMELGEHWTSARGLLCDACKRRRDDAMERENAAWWRARGDAAPGQDGAK